MNKFKKLFKNILNESRTLSIDEILKSNLSSIAKLEQIFLLIRMMGERLSKSHSVYSLNSLHKEGIYLEKISKVLEKITEDIFSEKIGLKNEIDYLERKIK